MKHCMGAIALCLSCLPLQVAVANPQRAILTVSPEQSRGLNGEAVDVRVWAGRATAIDFSQLDERITQVFLADPSRFTYATDVPLNKGEATTLFLRQILPLNFPNLTTAKVTNLFVKTRTKSGAVRLYTFDVSGGASTPSYSGLSVATSPSRGGKPTLQVGSFRPATLDDIKRGLEVALIRKYALPSDPIVSKTREFLAVARNTSDKSLVELAQQLKIPLAVLSQLGAFGIEDELANPQRPAREVRPGTEAVVGK